MHVGGNFKLTGWVTSGQFCGKASHGATLRNRRALSHVYDRHLVKSVVTCGATRSKGPPPDYVINVRYLPVAQHEARGLGHRTEREVLELEATRHSSAAKLPTRRQSVFVFFAVVLSKKNG